MRAIVDTNVIVRYFTDDPPGSAARATRVIDETDEVLVPEVVLAEVGFVLSTFYGLERGPLVDALIDFLNRRNVAPLTLDMGLAVRALRLCQPSKRVSFTDALTWAAARNAGVPTVISYDRRFPSDGIELRGA